MAQDKVVNLLNNDGVIIGSAKVDENGFVMAEIEKDAVKLFPKVSAVIIDTQGEN